MTSLHDDLAALDQYGDLDREEPKAPKPTGPRPGPRGWAGRGRGRVSYVQPPVRWRGTSVQVCGLNPWAAGSSAPLIGVPVGRIIGGRAGAGTALCCDPLSWFQPAGLISRPSAFIEGEPGMGKSALVKRMALGLAGMGVNPLVLGDLKPDYVNLTRALGGQVIVLGNGRGFLNVLDNRAARRAAQRLTGDRRAAVLADAHARRSTMVSALLAIQRHSQPNDREESIIDQGIRLLDDRLDRAPIPPDLLNIIREGPDDLRAVANDRGKRKRYDEITDALEASLLGMMGRGRLGETFARQTSEELDIDRPAAFDVSAIDNSQVGLQAAVLMACWSQGFGLVNIATALAEAGLEPERHFLIILDELWRALRAGAGMVDRIDGLTRLDRNEGVGQIQVTHSLADLNALPEIDRIKARGFVERAGMVIAAGLPRSEMPLLSGVIDLSEKEQRMLTSWSSPPAWSATGNAGAAPGRGNFLVKVGGRPGIPFHVEPEPELALNDTNQRWKQWANRTRSPIAAAR